MKKAAVMATTTLGIFLASSVLFGAQSELGDHVKRLKPTNTTKTTTTTRTTTTVQSERDLSDADARTIQREVNRMMSNFSTNLRGLDQTFYVAPVANKSGTASSGTPVRRRANASMALRRPTSVGDSAIVYEAPSLRLDTTRETTPGGMTIITPVRPQR